MLTLTLLALLMTPGDLDTAARTVWGEARGDPDSMLAVAWVLKNRVDSRHRRENTVSGVATEPYQFSCWLDSDPNRPKLMAVGMDDKAFRLSLIAVLEAWTTEPDPTNGATHYHTAAMPPPGWAVGHMPKRIGAHLFYVDID